MLVQDTLTGAVHEIPQSQLYEADYAESPDQMAEGQMLYDGLGNPVGFSFLKRLAKRALRAATKLGPGRVALADTWGRSPDPGGPARASRCNKQVGRRLLRRGRARPANARAGLATAAARMDSSPISLPGHKGSSHVFAMRLMARSKGFGARGCRTGTTGARSRCPTSPAGARSHGARSHGTAICSPPPALVQSPVSESSLCAGA